MTFNYINQRNKAADIHAGVVSREGVKVSFKSLQDLELGDLKIESFKAGSDNEYKRVEPLIKACRDADFEMSRLGMCDMSEIFKAIKAYNGF